MTEIRFTSIVTVSLFTFTLQTGALSAQQNPTAEWVAGIEKLAPQAATVQPEKERRVLLFSLYTGYKHDVIPYVNEVFRILGERTQAYSLDISNDIESLSRANLRVYDAVVLNNNCSIAPGRDIFMDVLGTDSRYQHLGPQERAIKAQEFENGLIEYVAGGAGLMAVHGAIVMQNNSDAFSDMLGGSFDFHPANQQVRLTPVEPEHPLLQAFQAKAFFHKDEPYILNRSYTRKNFRPLLQMNTDTLELGKDKEKVQSDVRYVSWIKKHGNGRVFYVSPSHNVSSYENRALLQFYLDGLQYVLGDLKCSDSPIQRN